MRNEIHDQTMGKTLQEILYLLTRHCTVEQVGNVRRLIQPLCSL